MLATHAVSPCCRSKGKQTSDNRIAILLGAVAVALGAWAWRSYRTRDGPGDDKAPGASPFKFPKSAKVTHIRCLRN